MTMIAGSIALLVVGIALALLSVVVPRLAEGRARRAADEAMQQATRRAAAVLGEHAALRPGRVTLRGTVELTREAEAPLSVRIEQNLDISSGGSRSRHDYAWREARRTIVSAPFYLRLSGGRVRVELPRGQVVTTSREERAVVPRESRVRVAARFAAEPRRTSDRTLRFALEPGAEVWVEGELRRAPDPEAGGYRENEGWILAASSEPIEVATGDPGWVYEVGAWARTLRIGRASIGNAPLTWLAVAGALLQIGMRVYDRFDGDPGTLIVVPAIATSVAALATLIRLASLVPVVRLRSERDPNVTMPTDRGSAPSEQHDMVDVALG
ncbi:MAG: hypothetical protein KF729_07870 [Sandaracinaceae bacterium]|nr:hypothetical protein [Sandaracinaceae bacterium]